MENKYKKLVIGVDPGKEGYITLMRSDQTEIEHFEMPKTLNELDLHSLSDLIDTIADKVDNLQNSVVVIEDVHAIHGASAVSTFNFGFVVGILRMGFIAYGFPVILVAPKKWQKEMYEGVKADKDKKVMSVQAAKRMFPAVNLLRTAKCKVPDNNLTDSLLIAEYGRRKFL